MHRMHLSTIGASICYTRNMVNSATTDRIYGMDINETVQAAARRYEEADAIRAKARDTLVAAMKVAKVKSTKLPDGTTFRLVAASVNEYIAMRRPWEDSGE